MSLAPRVKHTLLKQDETLLAQVVMSLDIAVLERIEQSDRFTPCGIVPLWWVSVFGLIDQQTGVLIRGRSSFLDQFLPTAQGCWAGQGEPFCQSGPLIDRTAEGESVTVEATALTINDRPMLLLRRLRVSHEEARATLQRAQSQELLHEEEFEVCGQTESRLIGTRPQQEALQDDLLAVLDELGLAIIVTDTEGETTLVGATAARLLEVHAGALSRPLEQLLPFSKNYLTLLRARIRQSGGHILPLTLRVDTHPPRWIRIEVHAHPQSMNKLLVFLQDTTEIHDLRHSLDDKTQFHGLIGNCPPMIHVFQQVRNIAPLYTTVLIEGETGTGKELVARAIHLSSTRRQGPFITVNCAGLTESSLGSQLFGHKQGAFANALNDQMGLFECADGGTIFLDEIGDVSVNVQAKVLRVLEEQEMIRLGDVKPKRVNVRVMAATHRTLKEDVIRGTFRADLLSRIGVARIMLPPLRERRDDIPLLAYAFLVQFRASTGKQVDQIDPSAFRQLLAYTWPGNVRELRHAIEYAALVCKDSRIVPEDLPSELRQPRSVPSFPAFVPLNRHDEYSRLLRALDHAGGNRSAVAGLLGISRATLYRRLIAHNLDR